MEDTLLFQLREETRENMEKDGLLSLDPHQPAPPPISLRDKMFTRNPDFAVTTHEPEANIAGMHTHDYFEMTYIANGACRHVFNDGKSVTFHKGNLCIMNPNIRHSCEICGWQDYVINLMITPRLFNSAYFSLFEQSNRISDFFTSYLLSSSSVNYMTFETPYDPQTDQIMDHLLRAYLLNDTYMLTEVRCYLILLFTRYLQNVQSSRPAEAISQLTQITAYISAHLQTATLKSVAAHFHFHPNYLSAYLKKHTGRNFQSLMTELKIQQARYYLSSTDLPVSQIASLLGFQDISGFYTMFRKHMHMTPNAFREANADTPEEALL